MRLWPAEQRKPVVIVRLLPLRDEADVLERNLRWYADSDIATVAFDNASSDDTAEIASSALCAGTLTAFERSEKALEWRAVADALLGMADRHEPDLVLVAAADEFFEVADGSTLRDAIEDDLRAGHDVLRVDTMEFCLTDEDEEREPDPIARMRRYSPVASTVNARGLRRSCGVQWPEARLLGTARENPQRSPRRYINRHYPLRTPGQALARAKSGRLRQVLAGSSAAAIAPLVRSADELLVPARKLYRYEDDHQWRAKPIVSDLRLAQAGELIARANRERAKLQARLADRDRSLADLRKRYTNVLLERERLLAAGAVPAQDKLAATPAWYDEHYRLTMGAYDAHYSESIYLPVWELIAERIGTAESVLEIGCGSGQLAELLIDRGLEHYRGFDFSLAAIELARQRLPDVRLDVADARTTTLLETEAYDVALATEVLEHLDDDVGLLRRIKPTTRVIATVPSFDSTSHLRFFANEQMVTQRYGSLLGGLTVARVPIGRGSVIFVLEGVALGTTVV